MLHGFIATMRALTSVGPHHPTGRYRQVRSLTEGDTPPQGQGHWVSSVPRCWGYGSSSASCTRQISLLISLDLPTIPPPTTAVPFRHGRFRTLHHRRDLPCLSPGQTSPVGGIAVARSRVRTSLGASPTGLAESSSLALRTGHSPQVALHPPSRERSYHCRIQAGNVSLRGTSTLLIKRLRRRTR